MNSYLYSFQLRTKKRDRFLTVAKEDSDRIVDDVTHALHKVTVVTILENLKDAQKKEFIELLQKGTDDPDNKSWLEYAQKNISKLDVFLDTAYMDALQRIKLGF